MKQFYFEYILRGRANVDAKNHNDALARFDSMLEKSIVNPELRELIDWKFITKWEEVKDESKETTGAVKEAD